MNEKLELLSKVSLFRNWDEAQLQRLASLSDELHFERDTVVLQQEEAGKSLYVILEGRVKIVLYGDDGKEIILTTMSDGEFFGEMALLDGGPRSASVVTLDTSRLLRLRRDAFMNYLREQPDLALAVLEELSRRLRRADSKIGSLALMDVYGRVARVLRELAEKEGVEQGDRIVIDNRPTHQEIAGMAGTSRETVSRILGDLARSGLIEMCGRQLILNERFSDEER
ncbi:MAG: Crp/Fnr family transcriptional regulator [Candidatus Dadabacteria bacterium]|nr:MAG: Crp/Fnr family transcriptional regulator [Candidatus Dadabacteria bacterium]